MNTPKQMNATETLAQISSFYAQRCVLEGSRRLTCARCGGEIRRVRAYMSLHDQQFGNSCVVRHEPGAWRFPTALPARNRRVLTAVST